MRSRNLAFALLGVCLALVTAGRGQAFAQTWTANIIDENWTSVVITSDGSKIAADSFLDVICTSTDGGTNWQYVGSPEQNEWSVLAASTNGGNLVAAYYDGGIYTSTNWGMNWRQSAAQTANWNCLASSADGTRLVAGTSPGGIYASKDSGATWSELTNAPFDFWHSLASSADGSRLLAASDGGVYMSTNAGTTWSGIAVPSMVSVNCTEIFAVSGSYTKRVSTKGKNMVVTNIFSDSFPASTFTYLLNSGQVLDITNAIAVNLTGLAATGSNNVLTATMLDLSLQGSIVLSNLIGTNVLGADSLGTNVIVPNSSRSNVMAASLTIPAVVQFGVPGGVALDTNFVNVIDANVYQTTNASVNVLISSAVNVQVVVNLPQNLPAVASSADGTHLAVSVNGGLISVSTNSGATWYATSAPSADWLSIAMSADGRTLTALAGSGLLYSSPDSGSTWAGTNVPPTAFNFGSVACSAEGSKSVAALYQGFIYTGQTVPAPAAALKISVAGGNITLAWPAETTAYTLQQHSALSPTMPWADLPATPVVTNGQNQVTLPMSTVQGLYRLRQQ